MTKSMMERYQSERKRMELGGGEKRIEKQHAQGKLTARERIAYLLDAGSFIELNAFVKHRCTNFGMESKEAPGEGVVTGYGTVAGRLVYVFAQDFTVFGGSLGEMHAKRIVNIQELAMKMGAPLIGLNDSGGARIQEGVDALSGYGEIFYNNTIASGVIPQISVIMGPCAGGAVYSPALTDFIFMVDRSSKMFITGPQVIKTVTGETVSAEELGGAMSHNTKSGVAHFMANSDEETLDQVKRLLSYLPSNYTEKPPCTEGFSINKFHPSLNEQMPENPNKPYDVKIVIETIADHDSFMEVQPYFAKNIVTGFVRIGGMVAGVVANQPKHLAGTLDIDASDKAARFIRFCDAFQIPLVTFIDVPGFLPGIQQEYGGIIRHGAKLLYAYSEATVPKISVILRKAYGGSYVAMSSKSLGADLVLAWPNAEVAVMGPAGAANIIFRKEIEAADQPAMVRQEKVDLYRETVANPYVAAQRGMVDDIIEPQYTRQRLISALDMLQTKQEKHPAKKHGNCPL
ncbi:acyl-CoA carboxylase subunit beta [Gottschalkiaceae bacterium SANA]|nr:acyl-CoA carboxylase subunit beta [Gottschalkiaceae bacterium SANA]